MTRNQTKTIIIIIDDCFIFVMQCGLHYKSSATDMSCPSI